MRRSLTARALGGALLLCVFVVHRVDSQSAPPKWTTTRDLRIDAEEQDLSPISWIAVARDGSIAVAQRQDGHIRFFDAKGVSIGTFGRSGEGPGEFRSMGLHGWVGDTLWVADASTRRMTLISPARGLERTFRFPAGIRSGAAGEEGALKFMDAVPRAMLSDGSLLVISMMLMGGKKPAWVPNTGDHASWLVRASEDGTYRRTLSGLGRQSPCAVSGRNEGGGSWGVSIPFCARPHWSIAPDGSRIVLADQPREPARSGAAYDVTSVAPSGDTVFAKQIPYVPMPINKRVADSTRTAFRSSVARQLPPAAARAVDDMTLPTVYPAMRSIIAGRDGTTWVERFTPPGEHLWHVLDTAGNLVGAVTLPVNIALHAASRDAIWATETDDDGLQSIVRYRIRQPR